MRRVQVVVAPRATTSQVARTLKKDGVIRDATVFVWVSKLRGLSGKMQAGQYLLTTHMNLFQVMDKIASGDVNAVWVTIPEGFTGRQIGRLLQKKHIVPYASFVKAVYGPKGSSSPASLEGTLFPDTYLLTINSTPQDVIRMMNQEFNHHVVGHYGNAIRSSGMSLMQILTIASIIEREAKYSEDRPLIASVIYNRLRIGMRLQIDATVEYALGEHHSRLFYHDLKTSSPYNTYLNPGLPPGPIANPGIPSIEAALKPATTEYLYYVAGPNGRHLFTKTAEEHAAAKRRIRGVE